MTIDQGSLDSPDQLLRPWSDIDVIGITAIVVAGWLLVFLVTRLVRGVASRVPARLRFYVLPVPPIVRLVVIITALSLIVPRVLVPRPEALFAVAGSSALALGFAFKDFVSSLLAGVVVLFERPCKVGDWVRIGDVYGRVEAMRLRVLELVTLEDDRVSIPLSKLWTEPVHNANSGRPDHQCVAEFFLDPEHDGHAAWRALEDVARTSAYRNLERPVVVVAEEQLFGTRYRVKAYPFDGDDQMRFITDLTLRGRRALAELGARPVRAMPGGAELAG